MFLKKIHLFGSSPIDLPKIDQSIISILDLYWRIPKSCGRSAEVAGGSIGDRYDGGAEPRRSVGSSPGDETIEISTEINFDRI